MRNTIRARRYFLEGEVLLLRGPVAFPVPKTCNSVYPSSHQSRYGAHQSKSCHLCWGPHLPVPQESGFKFYTVSVMLFIEFLEMLNFVKEKSNVFLQYSWHWRVSSSGSAWTSSVPCRTDSIVSGTPTLTCRLKSPYLCFAIWQCLLFFALMPTLFCKQAHEMLGIWNPLCIHFGDFVSVYV